MYLHKAPSLPHYNGVHHRALNSNSVRQREPLISAIHKVNVRIDVSSILLRECCAPLIYLILVDLPLNP